MGTQHTPGPWVANGTLVWVGDDMLVADASAFVNPQSPARKPFDYSERIANARLIAAAPDLLETLETAVDVVEGLATDTFCEECNRHAPKSDDGRVTGPVHHEDFCWYWNAKQAIAKARGEA